MDVATIVATIKNRRDQFKDAASLGTASDPLVASAAQVAWEMAAEYDSLLAEIESSR